MAELTANGSVADGRIKVDLDLGFGSIVLDIEQEALLDNDKIDILVDSLQSMESTVLEVFTALEDAIEARGAEARG